MAEPWAMGAAKRTRMGMILQFRTRSAQEEAEESARTPGAEIIIFPGVRRERHGESCKPTRRRGKPKRDRLELPE
jgi:hypothetical protein